MKSFRFFFRLSSGTHNKAVQWTNLNPSSMLDEMKKMQFAFPFKTLEDYMKRAGITNGYQSKPCLNPTDPECPETAPNKKSQQVKSPLAHTCSLVLSSVTRALLPIIPSNKNTTTALFGLTRSQLPLAIQPGER